MANGNADNLFSDIPDCLTEELVTILAENQHVRIERIVSNGHSSPNGFWYDQEEFEWVIVLKGFPFVVRFRITCRLKSRFRFLLMI